METFHDKIEFLLTTTLPFLVSDCEPGLRKMRDDVVRELVTRLTEEELDRILSPMPMSNQIVLRAIFDDHRKRTAN